MKLSITDQVGQKHEIASFSQRATAMIIDFVIIGLITLVIVVAALIFSFFEESYFLNLIEPNNEKQNGEIFFKSSDDAAFWDNNFFFYCFAMMLAIAPFYHILLEQSKMQGSLGKWVMHIKVLDKEAEPISVKGSIIRNFVKFYILIIMPLAIMFKVQIFSPTVLIFFWVIIAWAGEEDSYGRFLSDFPAGSFVIAS